MAAATTEPKTRKLRDDLDQAHNFYEDWMEPDWQPSTAASSTSGFRTAPNKERSKFKFAKEYDRDLSTGTKSQLSRDLRSAKTAADLQRLSKKYSWKPCDFQRFYKWVTNGTLSDLDRVREMLFED